MSGLQSVLSSHLGSMVAGVYVEDAESHKTPHVYLGRLDTDLHNTMDDETDDWQELVSEEVQIKVRSGTDESARTVAAKVAKYLSNFTGSMGTRDVAGCELRDFRSDPEEAFHGLSRGRSVIVVPVIIHHRPE